MSFARYVAVQLVAYAIDLGVFLLLLHGAATGAVAANVAAKVAAGAFAFVAHRMFTFGVRGRDHIPGQMLRYAILLALNVPLATLLLVAFSWLVSNLVIAKILADVACVGLTFLLVRHGVFGAALANPDGTASAAGRRGSR